MNEFFRTYGKWILAVLGVVLMIMWVMPTGQNRGGNSDQVVGRADGKKVYQSELREANNEVEVLGSFSAAAGVNLKGMFNQHNPALHFLLLAREARQMGMIATNDDVARLLGMTGMDETQVQEFCRRTGVSQRWLRKVLGDYMAIVKSRELAAQAISVSLPDVEHIAMDKQSKVTAAYVALSAENPPDSVHAPLSAEIAKQFEAYKDITAEAARRAPKEVAGHRFPFGYKYPDRVKVEYLKIPWDEVRKQVLPKTAEEKAADQEAAWTYYQEHVKDFVTTAPATTSGPATASAPATAPATTRPFTEVRAKLVDAQVDRRAYAKIREIAERAVAIASEPFKAAGIAADKRPEIKPEAWIPYAAIAHKIGEVYGIVPERSGPGPWLGLDELVSLPGIGKSGLPTPSGQIEPFATLALSVREITPKQSGIALRLQLQRGADGPVVFDEANNAYVYRVVDAQASHAPENVDEVREQVVQDLRRVAYFSELAEKANKTLVPEVEKDGLAAVAGKVGGKVQVTADFQRRDFSPIDELGNRTTTDSIIPPIPGLGLIPPFTEAAFNLAQKVGPVEHATSQPAATTAPAKVIPAAAVAFEPNLTVYVLQVDSYRPMPVDMFDISKVDLSRQLTYIDQTLFTRDWASLKAVAARLKYKTESGADLEKE